MSTTSEAVFDEDDFFNVATSEARRPSELQGESPAASHKGPGGDGGPKRKGGGGGGRGRGGRRGAAAGDRSRSPKSVLKNSNQEGTPESAAAALRRAKAAMAKKKQEATRELAKARRTIGANEGLLKLMNSSSNDSVTAIKAKEIDDALSKVIKHISPEMRWIYMSEDLGPEEDGAEETKAERVGLLEELKTQADNLTCFAGVLKCAQASCLPVPSSPCI